MNDDDRQEEACYARRMAAGNLHEVTVAVTVKTRVTLTLPGRDHTQEELEEAAGECQEIGDGEIIEVEEL